MDSDGLTEWDSFKMRGKLVGGVPTDSWNPCQKVEKGVVQGVSGFRWLHRRNISMMREKLVGGVSTDSWDPCQEVEKGIGKRDNRKSMAGRFPQQHHRNDMFPQRFNLPPSRSPIDLGSDPQVDAPVAPDFLRLNV